MLTNLQEQDAPASLYAEVAAQVASLVEREAEQGNAMAAMLEGWITRKVVKQTVMTVAYGVTAVGARRQIYGQLEKAGFDANHTYPASQYLSKLVREAVAQTCPAVCNAMKWLAQCARIIAKSGSSVCWTTPAGLVVEQPYRRSDAFRIDTLLQRISINRRHNECPVSVQRQVNGFAPNFVHSLDAEHMMRTALAAHDHDIRFAAVHDSYWTHACDMGHLSDVLRTEFMKLHASPLLAVLYDELAGKHQDLELPPPPDTGDLVLTDMLQSKYFFS